MKFKKYKGKRFKIGSRMWTYMGRDERIHLFYNGASFDGSLIEMTDYKFEKLLKDKGVI